MFCLPELMNFSAFEVHLNLKCFYLAKALKKTQTILFSTPHSH